jgi:lysophospholipase L1-like esterase
MITHDQPWLSDNETLVCFGDSLTAARERYVKIIAEHLAPRGIQVINAGRGGDKTPWALTRLQAEVIDRKPHAVSIFLGTNDAAIGRGRWADEPQVSPEAYRCNLVWIMYLCRLAGIQKFSITPPLWRFEGDAWAEFGDVMQPYRQAAREAADEGKARLVPADIAVANEWAKHPGHTGLLMTTDGVHLTAKGNQLVAATMFATWGLT